MKAILEFNLPEDQDEFDLVQSASDLNAFIWSYENEVIRSNYKYGITLELKTIVTDYIAELNSYSCAYEDGTEKVSEITDDQIHVVLHALRELWFQKKNAFEITSV